MVEKEQEKHYTLLVAEAAAILGVKRSRVYQLINYGDKRGRFLPTLKLGRDHRIAREDLQPFLDQHFGPGYPKGVPRLGGRHGEKSEDDGFDLT